MEPIKQAIERARSERLRRSNSAHTTEVVASPAHVVVRPGQALGDLGEDGQRIEYTRTRSLSVSAKAVRENRVILDSGNDKVAHAYNTLRTHVLQRLNQKGWKIIAITSPVAGAGKTLTSINLAISLARDINHTVLLVDMDLRKPGIHRFFRYQPELGLSDYLRHGAALEDILVHPGLDRLTVLPGREPILHSSEMLSSPRMVRLIKELRERYPARIVLLDMAPILLSDDVLAFSPYIDACLLVIEAARTKRDEIDKAAQLLERTNLLGTNFLGTVLNKSRETGRAYY